MQYYFSGIYIVNADCLLKLVNQYCNFAKEFSLPSGNLEFTGVRLVGKTASFLARSSD